MATEEEVATTRWRIPEPEGEADAVRTRAWEAADGSGATLSVRGGTLVERSAEGDLSVTSFQVLDESEGLVGVRCVGPEGATFDDELRLGRDGGRMTVSSGAFRLAGTYVEAEGAGTVRIEGVPEAYLSLVGDWQGFAHGVEAFCATWVPDAATATFSPEVSLDTASGRVTATLACDDPASTTVAGRVGRHDLRGVLQMGARGRRGLAAAFAATLALLAATLLAPTPAYASIEDDVNGWMCGVLRDCANWIFGAQAKVLASIGVDGVLSAPFETMLGSAGSASLYGIAHGVWQTAVLPIGCGVLSLVFTVQLIHISQRMDGNASMPGVREVVFLLVFFAVMLFLVQNSFELMRALYEVARLAIRRAASVVGSGGAMDLTEVSVVTEDDDVAALLAMIVVALVSWLVVIVAYVVALVVTWGRAIQIYMMAALSPIPLALMGLEDTRQAGVSFLRHFAGTCLAGIITLVLLVAFPVVLGGLDAASAGTGTAADSVVGGLSYALQYVAMCVLLVLSLAKSGSWARDALGG
ncbi:MAG: hypothetical protein LKE37_09905 [Atopobiaceae bacterium]|nr:hypothetical protein [Atopobiaceae bacterium]